MGAEGRGADQNLAAELTAAFKLTANPWTVLINGAGTGRRIQRDTCTVALLVHETHAIVFDHEFLRHEIHVRLQFDQQVAAAGAADAEWDIRMKIGGDASRGSGLKAAGDHY